MNNEQLNQGILALRWERSYRKRFNGDDTVSRYFLAVSEELDNNIEIALEYVGQPGSRVLDIGTGTGEQAICLAKLGYKVTATDISAIAIDYARQKASEKNVTVKYLVDNILVTNLEGPFDIIIDRGCYELIDFANAALYLTTVTNLLKPGGWFVLKTDCKKRKINQVKSTEGLTVIKTDVTEQKRLDGKTLDALIVIAQKALNNTNK